MDQTSIAREHVNQVSELLEDANYLKQLSLGNDMDRFVTKIREQAAELCRIGDTGTYEDPQEIIDQFKKLGMHGMDAQTDLIFMWLSQYITLEKQLRENGKLTQGILNPNEYERLIQSAKEEDVEWETKTRQENFERKRNSLFCTVFRVNMDDDIILDRELYKIVYQTGYLFWKSTPSFPEILPKMIKSKNLYTSVRLDKVLLAAQGYMYLELLEKAQDFSAKEKVLEEWEVAQKTLLAQNNSKETV